MKSELAKERIFTVFFMVAVTFVAILLVGLVEIATAKSVERNKSLFFKQAVADAAAVAEFESTEALLTWFDTNVNTFTNAVGEPDYFWVQTEDQEPTLVLIQKGPGLWGGITTYIGFDEGASSITGVNFQDHVETPGLGARIDEKWFRNQFVGKSGPFKELSDEPKDKTQTSEGDHVFDQITGATITSKSVQAIINDSIERARTLAENPRG